MTKMSIIYKELDKNLLPRINSLFPKKNCFIDVQPDHTILPRKFAEICEPIRELPTYKDDVWLVSYPRAGSTRTQELIWLLGNNLDFEGEKQHILLRAPIIELSALFSEDHYEWVEDNIGCTVEVVRNMPRPRFARSHLPWNLLPQQFETVKPKIIYVARNPKDLCVSFYHHLQNLHGLNGPFKDFVDLFLEDHIPIGSYWHHVLPFWKRSQDPNILFLKYEDMNSDLPGMVRKCARFLGVEELITPENLQRICTHLKFEQMKQNNALNMFQLRNNNHGIKDLSADTEQNKFIRKGQIGDWKNYLDEKMSLRFDEWIERNSKGSGLVFDYE